MRYSLGLDIGTTSVGWAVINEDRNRIEDLGVRIFERPENPKNGESLAKPRRDSRSTRRRLKRRRQRLNNLKHFFINQQLLTNEEIQDLLNPSKTAEQKAQFDPYQLREFPLPSSSLLCITSPNVVAIKAIAEKSKKTQKKNLAESLWLLSKIKLFSTTIALLLSPY